MKTPLPAGWQEAAGGLIVPSQEEKEAFIAASDEADAFAVAQKEVTVAELETFAYEFPDSEGRPQSGLAIGGISFLFVHHHKAEARWTDMQVHVGECAQTESRVFTVGVICADPRGVTAPGLCSAEERPLRRGSKTQRYFDKHAAAKALSCAERNAMRKRIPREVRKVFLREVLEAKHGVGRVEILRTSKRLTKRVATDKWLEANSAFHEKQRELKLDKDKLHAVVIAKESKYLGRKLGEFNQVPAARLNAWVEQLRRTVRDEILQASLRRLVDKATARRKP